MRSAVASHEVSDADMRVDLATLLPPDEGAPRAETMPGAEKGVTRSESATLEGVNRFNNRCLLKPIENIPPAEDEAIFYAAMERKDMAASLKSVSLRQTRCGPRRRVSGLHAGAAYRTGRR